MFHIPPLVAGLFVVWVVSTAAVLRRAARFNKVRCTTCGGRLRERHAIEHGGDPCAYTHSGICADRQAKIHADTYYT